MENKSWIFSVPIYPVHFSQVTHAVLKHVSCRVNKFVPELNGLLIDYQKKSLRFLSSVSEAQYPGCTLVPIRPELFTLHVRAQISVRVFSPRVGLEMNATVSAVQSHMVICKTVVSNVTITIMRSPNTSVCNLSTEKQKTDPVEQPPLNLNDVVRIRISSVSLHPHLLVLRGELVRIVSSASIQSATLVKRFITPDSEDERDSDSHNGVQMGGKKEGGLSIPTESLKPEAEAFVNPMSVTMRAKRKRPLLPPTADNATLPAKREESEPLKKKKRSRQSSDVAAASEQIISSPHQSADRTVVKPEG